MHKNIQSAFHRGVERHVSQWSVSIKVTEPSLFDALTPFLTLALLTLAGGQALLALVLLPLAPAPLPLLCLLVRRLALLLLPLFPLLCQTLLRHSRMGLQGLQWSHR